jgi:hypothetical protein
VKNDSKVKHKCISRSYLMPDRKKLSLGLFDSSGRTAYAKMHLKTLKLHSSRILSFFHLAGRSSYYVPVH